MKKKSIYFLLALIIGLLFSQSINIKADILQTKKYTEDASVVSASSGSSSKKYTEDELCLLAIKYYRKQSGNTDRLSVYSEKRSSGSIMLQVFENHETHTATLARYVVDYTGKGIHDIFGTAVDLSTADDSVSKISRPGTTSITTISNTTTGIKLTWKKVSNASGYMIYRKSGSGSYSLVKKLTSNSTVSFTDTSVKQKNGAIYTYRIYAYKGNVKSSASKTKSIIRVTPVAIASAKNSKGGKAVLKWSRNSKASSYQIQYSTSKSFTSGITKSLTVTGAGTTKKTLTKLGKGRTYYIRVRACLISTTNRKYYSSWSSTKALKINK